MNTINNNNYIVYHLHSDLSNGVTNIDSVTKYKEYVDYAKSLGMTALAFSEHGSVFEWVHKKEYIESAGMKYIHAVEAYLTEDNDADDKRRDNYHCVLLAKNYDGVKELNKLVSGSFNRNDHHFYYMPRITFEELFATSDNIIVTTACLGGVLNKGEEQTKKRFMRFLIANKDRCYLEVQHHNCDDQIVYNRELYAISKKTGIPLIAGTDTHCLNDVHVEGRKILQKAKNVFFSDEEAWDLTFKTYDELVQAYDRQNSLPKEVYLQAIDNTNVMADSIESFELDYSKKYPKLYSDSEKALKEKIVSGIKSRGIDKYSNFNEYKKKIQYELETYKYNGAMDFLLLEEDYKTALRNQGVSFGYSRGSVSGSIIAYLLGITEVDSIKYNLNFERFMNKERVSLADVDTDWSKKDRYKVREYLFNKDGLYCCDIITFNTIALKGAIKDVGRALGMTVDETQVISDAVYLDENKKDCIDDFYIKKHPELFKYVDIVKGTIVSIGNHPAGLVVSPYPVDEWFGLCSTKTNDNMISQINMKEIDGLSFVKLDVLGLDCVGLINETCDLAGIPRITPDNISFDDMKVWDEIRDDCTMIFQFESSYAGDYIKQLFSDETVVKIKEKNPNFSYIDLMSMANGAIRPAGASYRDELSRGEYRDNGHDALNEFLAPTLGFLVYQEQIIEFLHRFCGYTMGEADVVRRCVDENTLITMGNGKRKKIKDISVGDIVVTTDEVVGAIKTARVNRLYNNGVKNVIEIKTKNNHNIKLTPEHKVLTINGWTKASDVLVGDYIFAPMRYADMGDGLKPHQRLSCDSMFLIGMMIGDGCILSKGDMHFTNSDTALIDKFKDCTLNLIRKDKRKCLPDFSLYSQDGESVDKVYSIRVRSGAYQDAMWKLFDGNGLAVRSAKKHIPSNIMEYPVAPKLLSLIGGLFSTDGGYDVNAKSIDYSTTSEELAYDVCFLLGKCGIYSYVSSRNITGYDCVSYRVIISHKDSLMKFKENVVPYMVGNKVEKFIKVINDIPDTAYNYIVPKECLNKVICASKLMNRSLLSVGIKSGMQYDGMSDVKISRFIMGLYCPTTYKLLTSDYIPLKVTEINDCGEANVYDMEVDENHNYVANGLIVHNCFAKKLGTAEHIPKIKEGFIKTMKEKYDVEEEESNRLIESFIQVIIDASSYLFSLNHATPYSFLGYVVGWLRCYYKLETVTTALNIYLGDDSKSLEIAEYAKRNGIAIRPVRFGKSGADYTMDKENNSIYRGLASVKYCNSQIANELLELSENEYTSFIDLLKDINEKTSVNSRQLDILIRLNFFEQFGANKYLLDIVDIYNKFARCKIIAKKKMDELGVSEFLMKKYSRKETASQYRELDNKGLIKELCSKLENKPLNIIEQMRAELDFLGYVETVNEKMSDDYYAIIRFETFKDPRKPYVTLHRICDGEDINARVKYVKDFEKQPFGLLSILKINPLTYEPKKKKVGDEWVDDETEMQCVLLEWETVKE